MQHATNHTINHTIIHAIIHTFNHLIWFCSLFVLPCLYNYFPIKLLKKARKECICLVLYLVGFTLIELKGELESEWMIIILELVIIIPWFDSMCWWLNRNWQTSNYHWKVAYGEWMEIIHFLSKQIPTEPRQTDICHSSLNWKKLPIVIMWREWQFFDRNFLDKKICNSNFVPTFLGNEFWQTIIIITRKFTLARNVRYCFSNFVSMRCIGWMAPVWSTWSMGTWIMRMNRWIFSESNPLDSYDKHRNLLFFGRNAFV